MRRITSVFLLIVMSSLCLSGWAGEGEVAVRHSVPFEAGPMVIGEEEESALQPPKPTVHLEGWHITLGRAGEWFINNTVKHNGWSFTGWTKTGLDEEFRPWRLHIGIINGELDVNTAADLADRTYCTPGYELLEEWEHQRHNDAVVGIVFTRRF